MLQQSKKKILIIGCSQFGATIATEACKHNFYVTVVDAVESSFERLTTSFKGFTLIGDGTESETLKSAGIASADIVVAARDDDDDNVMIAQIATSRFDRKQVIAIVNDPIKKEYWDKIGITCICPISLAVRQAETVIFDMGAAEE